MKIKQLIKNIRQWFRNKYVFWMLCRWIGLSNDEKAYFIILTDANILRDQLNWMDLTKMMEKYV